MCFSYKINYELYIYIDINNKGVFSNRNIENILRKKKSRNLYLNVFINFLKVSCNVYF